MIRQFAVTLLQKTNNVQKDKEIRYCISTSSKRQAVAKAIQANPGSRLKSIEDISKQFPIAADDMVSCLNGDSLDTPTEDQILCILTALKQAEIVR